MSISASLYWDAISPLLRNFFEYRVMDKILQYVEANKSRYLDELKDFIAIPSVSTNPENKPDVLRCAEWISAHLRTIGMQHVQIFPTPGHPIVYADSLFAPGR